MLASLVLHRQVCSLKHPVRSHILGSRQHDPEQGSVPFTGEEGVWSSGLIMVGDHSSRKPIRMNFLQGHNADNKLPLDNKILHSKIRHSIDPVLL